MANPKARSSHSRVLPLRSGSGIAALGLLVAGALAFALLPMPAHAQYEAPPAAAGSIQVGDLGVDIDLDRPSALPVVPEQPEHLAPDPEQDREELRAQVQMELDMSPQVDTSRVLAHVTALGEVRLTGVVRDENEKAMAEGLAAAVPGVTGVDNDLRLEDGMD